MFGDYVGEYQRFVEVTQKYLLDKQAELKTAIESVQTGTDKIIDDMASATKQDLLKGVMDSVKSAVETLQNYDEELHEFDPIVIYDDDETFWTVHSAGVGSYEGAISEEKTQVISGSSSTKLVIGAGAKSDIGFVHYYDPSVDYSGKRYLPVWIYGVNTGLTLRVQFNDGSGGYIYWNITDNWSGWARKNCDVLNSTVESSFDPTDIDILFIYYMSVNQEFTSYLDRIVIDNMKPRLEGTISKLIDVKDKLTDVENRLCTGVIASDNLRLSSDGEVYQGNMDPVKKKEVGINMDGVWRIKFEMKSVVGGTAYGQIYKNGVAHGTQRETAELTYQSYSEDLWVNEGDLVQLYLWHTVGANEYCYAKNFRFYADYGLVYGSVIT